VLLIGVPVTICVYYLYCNTLVKLRN